MIDSLFNQENIEYASQLAWKFGWTILGSQHEKSITMDDLRQESFLGLWEAGRHYNPAQGLDFHSLAYIWCRKFVLHAIRKFSTQLTIPDNFDGDDDFHLNGFAMQKNVE